MSPSADASPRRGKSEPAVRVAVPAPAQLRRALAGPEGRHPAVPVDPRAARAGEHEALVGLQQVGPVRDQGDTLVDGQRAAAALPDGTRRVLGPDVAELLAALHVDQEVRRSGWPGVLDRVVAGQVTRGAVAVD